MEFPKDHELFKDIKPDGTLEYTDGLMENLVKDNSYGKRRRSEVCKRLRYRGDQAQV